jgi:hypothetical protein
MLQQPLISSQKKHIRCDAQRYSDVRQDCHRVYCAISFGTHCRFRGLLLCAMSLRLSNFKAMFVTRGFTNVCLPLPLRTKVVAPFTSCLVALADTDVRASDTFFPVIVYSLFVLCAIHQGSLLYFYVSITLMDARQHLSQENKMLHCKPSQIQLTSADVNELDERISNRRRAFSDMTKGKARLSTGPRLPTIIAAAHAEGGIVAQHASTSTQFSPTRPAEETTKRLRYAIPTREASALVLRPHLRHASQSAPTPYAEPVKIDSLRTSPSPPPRLSLPKLDIEWDTSFRHCRRQTSPSHHAVATYDGADDAGEVDLLRPTPKTTVSSPVHGGRQVFRELPGGATTALPPSIGGHRTPGAQARRSKTRSQEDETQWQEDMLGHPSPRNPSPGTIRPRHRYDVPSVQIMRDLDPSAPVFTPRVRFGSTTIVPGPESASTEATDPSTLRLRTPSEQNASPGIERRPQANIPISETRQRRPRSNAIVPRTRRSSENSALPSPNLDRYPLLLPNNRGTAERERREPATPTASVPHESPVTSPPVDQATDTSSTPEASSSRIPSIVSAASGISSVSISDDAAAEFLRFRSSPLDGLTAELSRLSTALGPATKPTDKRISLLSGNPFDSNSATTQEELPVPELSLDIRIASRDLVSSRLLSSPSHLTLSSSPIQPSAPLPHTTVSPASVASRPCRSTIRLVDATASTSTPAPPTATPKLPVYNDATPARLQPQTPADLVRASRRTRNRSDSSVHREAFCVGQVLVAPQPAIPERRAYRNTYPTNAPGSNALPLASTPGTHERNASGRHEAENETEGQLAGLEGERAVWMRRRQGGSLDVTPPSHGRFERFLH